MYNFPRQKVVVETRVINDGVEMVDDNCDEYEMRFVLIKDAILDKVVLKIGTNYTDRYYPYCIFQYNPMNLYANVEMSMQGVMLN